MREELRLSYIAGAEHPANVTGNKESKTIRICTSSRLCILEETYNVALELLKQANSFKLKYDLLQGN